MNLCPHCHKKVEPIGTGLIRDVCEQRDRYRDALEGFAEGDCAYGEGCPDTATHHGRCTPCKARKALNYQSATI